MDTFDASAARELLNRWDRACALNRGESVATAGSVLAPSRNQLVDALRSALAEVERLRDGLRYYADGEHAQFNESDAWDSVSGEPPNFLCDEAGTATIEDGTVAKRILEGWSMPSDPDEEEMTPPSTPPERSQANE